MAKGNIIYCKYEGFVAGEKSGGALIHSDYRKDAKVFSDNEIEELYFSLELDHPLSETSILTLEEAETATFKRI